MTKNTGLKCITLWLSLCLSNNAFATNNVTVNDALKTLRKIEAKLTDLPTASQPNVNSPVASNQPRIASGEFLLFSLSLNDYYLGEVFALKSDQGIQLGLSSLADILQFGIEVDLVTRSAQGWYRDQQPFILNASSQPATLITDAGILELTAADISIDDDMYIEMAQLKEVFGLQFTVDYGDLEIELSSAILLPIEQQRERHARRLNPSNRNAKPTLPWKASPYQALSSPVADLQLNYSADKNQNRTSYSLLGAQDFAYLSAEYFLSGREGDLLSDSRLTFTKQDPQSSLLGVLAASEVEFGDVTATQVGSRYNSQYGRGIKFSNRGLTQQFDSNRINLSGPVQLGWDVELYRNGILIAQQISLSDGRYNFENVDLFYGENNFELIFYGPQGQVERKSEYYFIDSNQLAQGEGFYELSVSEQGKKLLGNTAFNNDSTGWQIAGRYEQGITDDFSIYTAALAQKRTHDDLQHMSLGTNLSLFSALLLNLDYQKNNQHEQELELTARTQFADQSLLFSATNRTDELKQKYDSYQFDMAGELMQNSYGRLNYQNNLLYQTSDNRGIYKQAQNRLNYAIAGLALSNQLQWQQSNNVESVYGSTRLQGRLGRIYSRFSVDYTLSPSNEVTSYEAEFNRSITSQLQAEVTLRDSRINDIQSADLGLSWQSNKFSLTSNLNYDSEDNWQLGVYSRFSLGYDTQNNHYFVSKQSLTTTGTLMLRVFLDQNNNGIMDPDEQGVAGIKVKGLQNYRQAITDENGIALLTSMPANRTTDIVLDRDSFPDPFFVPANEGFSITPRAGFIEYMDYPLNNASEIEGVVYQQQGDHTYVQPYATITLLDEAGKEVANTQAAYDGYYLFTDLRPGQYRAVVDDSFKERKALKNTQQVTVDLSAKGDVLVGVDFTLKSLEEVSGTIVNAGNFSSLMMLKAYLRLISPRLKLQQQDVFYIHDQQQSKYILALGYAEQAKPEFTDLCQSLIQQGLKCDIEQRTILY
ncbi:hypothetical protein [Pseudoalteromonas arctica]|uniref:hypothetical protein n=1 Tax=Pseudoalteromonas arctica TaxID=394751 RepID=UPI001B7D5D43|nr:hypothetical protein [Pseudoalteromonas arctica]